MNLKAVSIFLVVLALIACASVVRRPGTSSSTEACVRVFNDSDEYLAIRVQPTGTLLGRVRAISAKILVIKAYPLGQSYLTAEPVVGQGVDRYSPRFTFAQSRGWRWKIEPRLGLFRERQLEQDLWPMSATNCAKRKTGR